ncbi:MAG: UDP-N-acetylmuramate dehydrogenase, partial [Candidatus Gastranaerophilales bacterium]|nr:UDP-N-acetylmuramate dehydrogenase [Candidatus Gastranaerophilales bacterium]
VDKAAFPASISELIALLNEDIYDLVLGNCSNVLFSSEKINKKVIITKNINNYTFDGRLLNVECGAVGPVISKECAKRNLSGFEFLIGIPGSFGGMIYMNASAHNQSISDVFVNARVYDINSKKIKILNKDEMKFSYRNSKLVETNYVLLDACFELKEGNSEKIEELMQRNIIYRKTKQPSLICANAGSIFKNPQNDSAGRLLDLCKMKGEKEGGAMVFENHANFILNYNNATSLDVLTLMYKMYSKVREKYTIELIPEIKYIGNKESKEFRLWKIMTENIQMTQK